MTGLIRVAPCLVAILLASASASLAQETLAGARQLYGAAAYAEALGVLDRLRSGVPAGSPEANSINLERTLCMLALGRQAEAESTIEALISADPAFRPDQNAVSPRVLGTFAQVRRRLLPGIAQQHYLTAKAAFDRKEYPTALQAFDATLALIDEPDLTAGAKEPPLSDLRTLALGFRDLARAAVPPPPAPAVAPPPPAPPAPAFYTADDAGVTPPVVISQRMPQWPASAPPGAARKGTLDILIGEDGSVVSAALRGPIASFYDDRLLAEAARWKFKPATKGGKPVRFRKIIQINFEKP